MHVASDGPSFSIRTADVGGPAAVGVKQVRAAMPEEHRARSTAKGVALFAVGAAWYAATFAAIFVAPSWPLKLLAAAVHAVATSVLFVIGHDACHGSLTPRPRLNKLLGRLCLLPSYHPCASWEHTHNGLHHGWTNVRGKDPVYVPFSKQQYDALPPHRRLLERVYRTWLGLGLFYWIEIWAKFEFFPRRDRRAKRSDRTFQIDRMLVVAFAAAQVALVAWHASRAGAAHWRSDAAALFLFALVLPHAAFNWAMGFVTFMHHTHPTVPWYADETQWSFFAGQVRSVVHVEFPRPIELLLHNIMDHTAHHVDPRIPLYHLHASQAHLEGAYAADIVSEKWTFRGFARTLATCRLYDYENQRWLDYDGRPTTPVLMSAPVPAVA